jgi:site-specific recombinase XerD
MRHAHHLLHQHPQHAGPNYPDQATPMHLKRFFESNPVPQITTLRIKDYIESRLAEGTSDASINRELSALKRMLNLGAQHTPPLVDRVPHIPMLKEINTRKGFFEHDEFIALRNALPDNLKGFVTFAYRTGWRLNEPKFCIETF